MILFLSKLPVEDVLRELRAALGATSEPVLHGVTRDKTGAIDTTAPHWYALDELWGDVLVPHDGTNADGWRAFEYRYRWYDGRIERVRAMIDRIGMIAPEGWVS